jgi:hypothetical protein
VNSVEHSKMLGPSSKEIQKARRSAKRTRTSVACARCKNAKIKCSEYRPCKQCKLSMDGKSCSDVRDREHQNLVEKSGREGANQIYPSFHTNVPHLMDHTLNPDRALSSTFMADRISVQFTTEHGSNTFRPAQYASNINCSRELVETMPPSEPHLFNKEILPHSSSGFIIGCTAMPHDTRPILGHSQQTNGLRQVSFLESQRAMLNDLSPSSLLPESAFTASFDAPRPDLIQLLQLHRPPPPTPQIPSFWPAMLPPRVPGPPPLLPNLTVLHGGHILAGPPPPHANALRMLLALSAATPPPSVPFPPLHPN